MAAIVNLDSYTSGMQKSMRDKMWFMDFIGDDVRTVYDYGCADGSLLNIVHQERPDIKLVGYDNNPDMVRLAHHSGIHWAVSSSRMEQADICQLTVVSSVLHEIHAYGSRESIRDDYRHIFSIGSEYIAIRDMFYSKSFMPEYADPETVRIVRSKSNREQMEAFESLYGPITRNKNLLHWFLKYRYTGNWERELHENYLFESIEHFCCTIPEQYEVVYLCSYPLPYLRRKILQDYGILWQYPTHGKLLLKRKH